MSDTFSYDDVPDAFPENKDTQLKVRKDSIITSPIKDPIIDYAYVPDAFPEDEKEDGEVLSPEIPQEESTVIKSGALYGAVRGAYNVNRLIPGLPQLLDQIGDYIGTPTVAEPETTAGQLTGGFTQAAIGIIPVVRVLKTAGYTGIMANTVSGFLGDFATSDAADALGIAALVDKIDPTEQKDVANAIRDFVTDETGEVSDIKSRLVGSVPGIILTPPLEATLSVIGKGLRKYKGTSTGQKISNIISTAAQRSEERLQKMGVPIRSTKKPPTSAGQARLAELLRDMEASDLAEETAKKQPTLTQDMIDEFEDVIGVDVDGNPYRISIDVDGKKVYDPETARETGTKIMNEKMVVTEVDSFGKRYEGFGLSLRRLGASKVDEDVGFEAYKAKIIENPLTQPLLKPENFNKLIAVVADLRKNNPDLLVKGKKDNQGNVMPLIDQLVELTANKELLPGDELIPILNKYGLSFEDYILSIVGTGSKAGQALNKLSQIRKARTKTEFEQLAHKAIEEAQGVIRNNVMRVENIRRGGLVSQLATAMRNLTSGIIRAPAEGLGNVLDTSLYQFQKEGSFAAAKALISRQNWQGSFKHMKYIFSRPDRAEDFTDYLVDRPETAEIFDMLFNNINEIQIATGRGRAETTPGKVVDYTLSKIEDAVQFINTPNRWQEFLMRRGMFFGELERLVRREYDLDLVEDVLAKGRIKDLMNDAPDIVGNNQSFVELMSQSATKALDVTYAKQPQTQVYKSISSFITRNGLTVLMPFPRFMFNSMEIMGNYVAGGSIPILKQIHRVVGNKSAAKMTALDRQRISRNLVGMAAMSASYAYVTSDDAPADYKEIKLGIVNDKGLVVDTTPQFPMRQFLMLGKLADVFIQGSGGEGTGALPLDMLRAGIREDMSFERGVTNLTNWLGTGNNKRDFIQTFLGINFRMGAGGDFLQSLMAGVDDAVKAESEGRKVGRFLGNYLNTWLVPYAQIINMQRAAGVRDVEYKDTAQERGFGFRNALRTGFKREMARTGVGLGIQEERELPQKVDLGSADPKRVGLNARILFGLNLKEQDTEDIEFLKSIWYDKWELGSKSISPEIRRFENSILREIVPDLVSDVRERKPEFESEYEDASDAVKNKETKESYVRRNLYTYFDAELKNAKSTINDAREAKFKSSEDLLYIKEVISYRRIRPIMRMKALEIFRNEENRDPNLESTEDLILLNAINEDMLKPSGFK